MKNRFIAATAEYSDYGRNVPAPYMRGSFTLESIPQTASFTVTALGFYDAYVNGTRVTKGIMAPYVSNPDGVVVFDRYDIRRLLRVGKNTIGLILGNGFTNAFGGFTWGFDKADFRSFWNAFGVSKGVFSKA